MNCNTVKKLAQDYHERRLSILDRNEVVHHASECASCEAELAAYRDVFVSLRGMKAGPIPRGFQNRIVSQLKSEGLIYQPEVPLTRQWLSSFLALRPAVRYPMAAAAIVGALYLPVVWLLALARGSVAEVTLVLTNAFVSARDAFGQVSFIDRFFEQLESYARLAKTIINACTVLLTSMGENVLLLGIGMTAVLTAALVFSVVARRKRSSHNVFAA